MTPPDAYDGTSASVTSRDGNVVTLTVEPGDTVDAEFRMDLRRARRVIVDVEPGAVVLTGEPGAFEVAPDEGVVAPDDAVDTATVEATVPSEATQLAFEAIATVDCPVIAALRADVSDAGFALGLCADLRIGGETSTYGVPAVGGRRVMAERVKRRLEATAGRSRAQEFASAAGRYDAETVAEWGLLNEVVADAAVVDRALTVAEELAQRPVLPYRYAKWSVDAASSVPKSGFEFQPVPPRPLPPAADDIDLLEMGQRFDGKTVTVDEPRDGVARITLDRRHRLNAISAPMIADFLDAVDDLAARDLRAVVVEGAGRRAFSIGLDMHAPISRTTEPAVGAKIAESGQAMTDALASLRVPVVAAISGRAFGGGFEIALAADARVGGESSTYGLPEVTRGALPAAGGTQRLPAIVGAGRATEMLFTGETFDAATMAEWGVLRDEVPDEEVTETALDVAERLSGDGTGDREGRAFAMDPATEGYLLERAGLGHAVTLDPFDAAKEE